MNLRRRTRWLAWTGLIGGLSVAVVAFGLRYSGLAHEREAGAAKLATTAYRQLTNIESLTARGEISRPEAEQLARNTLTALEDRVFRIRIVEGGAPLVVEAEADRDVRLADFGPWNWTIVVASKGGESNQQLVRDGLILATLLAGLLATSWRIAGYMTDTVVKPAEGLAQRMRLLADGRGDFDIPGLGRTDEFGVMARALERFRQSARLSSEREGRLSGIMAGVDEAILLLDDSGRIEQSNAAAARLFPVDLRGRGFVDLFGSTDRQQVQDMIASLRTNGRPGQAQRCNTMSVDRGDDCAEVSLSLTLLSLPGWTGFVAVLADMTDHMREKRELLRLATRDRLTGLPNRAFTETLIDETVKRMTREGGGFAVLSLDLSRFKLITDTLGYRAGDQLLLEVTRRIQKRIGPADIVGRFGTDDFAVIVDRADAEKAKAIADAILGAFDEPVQLVGTQHYVRPSIGISLYPDHGRNGEHLIRAADAALYAAKRGGGLQIAFYTREMGDQARRHLAIDQQLRQALTNGEFLLHYQPQVSLVDFSVEGFEALLRWKRPGVGIVSPGDFLSVAEDTGFISALDDWVFDEVCRQLRDWMDLDHDPLPVAVNVSARHLRRHDVVDFEGTMRRHGVPPSLIEVEVTESAVMQDLGHAMDLLGGLKELGVGVAVDDFGTGHSSLSYLKRLPVSRLKIDRSFVAGVPKVREDAGIVATIIAMADLLRLQVVAEGVERAEQAQFLRHHNCLTVQGWYTGYPLPVEDVTPLLAARQKLRA